MPKVITTQDGVFKVVSEVPIVFQIGDVYLPDSQGTSGQILVSDDEGRLYFDDLGAVASALINDTSPQLGGNLDVNDFDITGNVRINSLLFPSNDGTNGQVLVTDGSGNLLFSNINLESNTTIDGGTTGQVLTKISNTDGDYTWVTPEIPDASSDLIDDETPQLGGNLDVNGYAINGNIILNGLSIPTFDGDSGQALVTNGNGSIGWIDVYSPFDENTTKLERISAMVSALASEIATVRYTFNGSTMYATIPGWQPKGLPWQVRLKINPTIVDSSERQIIGGDLLRLYLSAMGKISVDYVDESGATQTLVGPAVSHGNDYTIAVAASGHGVTLSVNGSITENNSDVPAAINQDSITVLAASEVPDNYFAGQIWDVEINDYSSIQDTTVMHGDGGRSGILPDLNNSHHSISFDYRFKAGDHRILGGKSGPEANVSDLISVANGLLVSGEGVSSIDLDGHPYGNIILDDGQDYRITAILDEGSIIPATVGPLPTDGIISNVIIYDVDDEETGDIAQVARFPMNEGSNTVINNIDDSLRQYTYFTNSQPNSNLLSEDGAGSPPTPPPASVDRTGIIFFSGAETGDIQVNSSGEDGWRVELPFGNEEEGMSVVDHPAAGYSGKAIRAYWHKDWPLRNNKIRSELKNPAGFYSQTPSCYSYTGKTFYYGISLYVKDNANNQYVMYTDKVNQMIIQFHLPDGEGTNAFHVRQGILGMNWQGMTGAYSGYTDLFDFNLGVVHNVVMAVKQERDGTGRFELWHSEGSGAVTKVVDYTGPTQINGIGDYAINTKIGVYRSANYEWSGDVPPGGSGDYIEQFYDEIRIGDDTSDVNSVRPTGMQEIS